MTNFIAQSFIFGNWRRWWGSGQSHAASEHERLLITLQKLVDNCEVESDADALPLMSDRYYAIARAAREGRYKIQADRIAQRLLQDAV